MFADASCLREIERPPRAAVTGRSPLLLVFPSREDGGTERYIRSLAFAAVGDGREVHAAFPLLESTATLRAELAGEGVRCHVLPLGMTEPTGTRAALYIAAREAVATTRLLRRVRPRATLVVLPHPDQSPGPVLALAAHRSRSAAIVQMVTVELRFTPHRRRLYTLARMLGQSWIAVSADNRRKLAQALRWDESQLTWIYNGVSDELTIPPAGRAEARRRLRDELQLPMDARLVLSVARLNYQKAYDVIADSISDVASSRPDTHWVWVGDGPERESLNRQLEAAGVRDRVHILGYRPDLHYFLAACDVFLFPSRYEGVGLALLQALLSELPVIVSDAGPLPEIVTDRVDGLIVPVEDAHALGAATSWVLEHDEAAHSMGLAGRQRVLSAFSEEKMLQATFALLDSATDP
jgi:glycosyltransferase involved in cell wall biosynthesis